MRSLPRIHYLCKYILQAIPWNQTELIEKRVSRLVEGSNDEKIKYKSLQFWKIPDLVCGLHCITE